MHIVIPKVLLFFFFCCKKIAGCCKEELNEGRKFLLWPGKNAAFSDLPRSKSINDKKNNKNNNGDGNRTKNSNDHK